MRGFTTSYKSGVRREGLGDGQDFFGKCLVLFQLSLVNEIMASGTGGDTFTAF